jgi:glycine oxidase
MSDRTLVHLGVAGNGLAGRLLALQALESGHRVSVFERRVGQERCAGEIAAGMLSPLAELETGGDDIHRLGMRSLALWPTLMESLGIPDCFSARGSLVTSHPRDSAMTRRLVARISQRLTGLNADPDVIRPLDTQALKKLEPGLQSGGPTYLFDGEGQVDAQAFMNTAGARLVQRAEVHEGRTVTELSPGQLRFANGDSEQFDWVFDCRGVGAHAPDLPVRGVRGELLWLETSEVELTRPVRVMHPRYRIYVVPRPGHHFIVGATEIESMDTSPISVRSMMELASATVIVDPAFLEARMVRAETHLRPALPDNQPLLDTQDGITRINGLFRHGYLIAPALVEDAMHQAHIDRYVA